ncbi:MAG: HD domain-containing phosphohydrolase [Treponemataceae bacterium]
MPPPKKAQDNYRAKYVSLVNKYNRLVHVVKKNSTIFKRLYKNYTVVKQRLLQTLRHADREKKELLRKSMTEKYPLILDHRRRIVFASAEFLEEIEMTQDELAASFYIDTLFERFLPNDFTVRDVLPIPTFHFPVMLKNYEYEGEAGIHPFVHYSMSGKREFEVKRKLFLYYLEPKDISSEVELDYFQKTDKLIRNLTNANDNLQNAKKTIEMHKLMLISLVCSLIEEYNKETSVHLQNIRLLTGYLTEECLRLGLFPTGLHDEIEFAKDINYTSVLHDIGKMGVPKEVLDKKGKLTPEEFESIKKHPRLGATYIKKMIDMFAADPAFSGYEGFLSVPYDICLHHHERWDGTGYPDKMAGEAIPFCARVVALVDSYDAMRAKRSYNVPKSHAECVRVIADASGKQFAPDVVQAFLNIEGKFDELEYE